MDFQSPQNGMYDPSSFIDPSAIANSQMNGTRSYPMSSIPQKRDSTGATLSRSQTPSQQPQFGFQQGFSHTPSPTMQNQHFRPGQMPPQRMQTASPAQNPHAPQMSPMGFAQGSPMAQGFDPNAGGQFPVQSVQLSQNLQSRQQEAQRQYAMRLQHQQQQLGNLAASNMAAQQRHQAGPMPNMAGQHPGMQPHMMQGQQQTAQLQAQAFMNNVKALMAQHNRPFNPRPQVAGRAINLQHLYQIVMMKFKGYRVVTQSNMWPQVAQMLGIPPQQFPTAAEELRITYEHNLGPYEAAFIQKQQQQQRDQQMKGMNSMQSQMGGMGQQMSPTRAAVPGMQNSAAAQQEYLQQLQRKAAMQRQRQSQSDASMQQQPQFEPPTQQPQQSTPMQHNATLANVNGRSTPQADANAINQHRKSMSRTLESTPTPGRETGQASTTPSKPAAADLAKDSTEQESAKKAIENGVYSPAHRYLTDHYGLLVFSKELSQCVDEKLRYLPNVPELGEMGVVDIRSLTMSLRSGLITETRLALDILSKLTYAHNIQVDLEQCEDLVDVLVDYAEDQLEILANDNPEVTDIIDLMAYEDVIHHCEAEVNTLQDLPPYGTKEHDLDRTANRLLAITTILRNLSFLEINHGHLSEPAVLKFLSNAIRLVGTRVLLLRSHVNTFDFMKDLVTFFSNTSTRIALPSREDAYTILHFLCAFAPCPRPTLPVKFTAYNPKLHRYLPSAVDSLAKLLARDDPNRTYYKQIFINEATSDPPYDLLTRAFALAIAVVPDRLEGKLYEVHETRFSEVRAYEARIADARKPYLMQGMLAADILASLAPGPESGICRSWLEAEDGWASSLLKFAMSLCSADANHPPPQTTHRGQRPIMEDREGYQLIVHRALSTLKRLGDKSKGAEPLVKSVQTNGHANRTHEDEEDDEFDDMETFEFGGTTWKVRGDVLPKKETVLGAMLMHTLDGRSLRQFAGLGYLAEN